MQEPTGLDGGQAFAISCFSFHFLLQGPTLIGFSLKEKNPLVTPQNKSIKVLPFGLPLQPM
jgi:hypothetical protein